VSARTQHAALARLFALLLALAMLASGGPAAAQAEPPAAIPREIAEPLSKLTTGIEAAERAVQQLKELEDELSRLRIDVEGILEGSTRIAETLRPQLAATRGQIERLGPAPAAGQPPEAPAIAAERARLAARASELDGAIKAAELSWLRARQLIDRITVMRHAIFTRNLLERQPSPLLPALWRDVWFEAPGVARRFVYLSGDWWSWGEKRIAGLVALATAVVVVLLGLGALVRRFIARQQARAGSRPRTYFERALRALGVAPLRMLPGVAAVLLAYGGLDALDLVYPPWDRVIPATARALLVFTVVSALVRTVLATKAPEWRMVPLADGAARRIAWYLQAFALVFALDIMLTEVSRAFFVPLALSVVQSFVTSLLFAGLLVGLLLIPFERQSEVRPEQAAALHSPFWLKGPLWLAAGTIIAASMLGYIALGRFLAQQIVLTGTVLVVSGLVYLAIRALTRDPAETGYPVDQVLEARFGFDAPRRQLFARLGEAALTLLLVAAAIPVLMLQWGFAGADIRDWFKSLFFGFEIGQFRISLARIVLGIVLFMALLFATRLVQRWLRESVLREARFETGIANSIDTAVGYLGTGLAALLAVSYAGFDVTNLAIVAGALSVGIGFGLQSIVNNFVSGLILLVERPIKVGDWIVVGNEQGNVRRISVRATEIETFDRASLIIPNSELITGRVVNWTHRNVMGRVIVKVAVSEDADPEQVMAIMKAAGQAHPAALTEPPPTVSFDNFGSNGLEFALRVHLVDINKGLGVQTELRTEILRRFRAARIGFANAQHDVRLRDLDIVRQALANAAEARRREQAGGGGGGSG
jgi:small-conductance mechanosensitive channel